jgi:hypothetical protein
MRHEVAGELVVVEKEPAPDFPFLSVVAAAVPSDEVRQVMQDYPGLREPQSVVKENRNLPHFVNAFPPFCRPRLAIEKINIDRSPIEARHFHQQGSLVRVAGFGETVKDKIGHGDLSRSARTQNGNGNSAHTPPSVAGGVCATFNTMETVVK